MKTKRFPRGLYAPEALESRIAPATIIVNSLLDNGDGANTTLREAIVQANLTVAADVIVFKPGLTGEIALNGTQLDITDSLKIVGPGAGKIVIDAGDVSRIFNITDGTATVKTVSISGLSMVEGNAGAGNGGGIFSEETLSLSNVVVSGSTTTGIGGGIFVNTTGKVSVKASIVSGNNAGSSGGGMYLEAGAITVSGCTISGNTAATDGGGLYAHVPSTGTGDILVENSGIVGNTAGDEGGGAALDNDRELAGVQKGKVTVRNSIISGNNAGVQGGALYLDDGFVLLERVQISNNSAPLGGGISDDSSDSLTIKNSTITGNRATDAAGPGGGGLFLEDDAKVSIISSVITGNSSASDGGGLSIDDSVVLIRSSVMTGNTSADDGGGAQLLGSGDLTVESSRFFDNGAGDNGGGLHVQSTGGNASKLVVKTSFFYGNRADGSGGGVDVSATGNQDESDAVVTISGTRFIANVARGDDGGGLYLRSSAAIIITSSIFTHNSAGDDGGGLALSGAATPIRLLGTLVRDNVAAGDDGGGIALFGGTLILNATTSVMYNAADDAGGGILSSGATPVQLNGSKVAANTAPADPQISGPFTP